MPGSQHVGVISASLPSLQIHPHLEPIVCHSLEVEDLGIGKWCLLSQKYEQLTKQGDALFVLLWLIVGSEQEVDDCVNRLKCSLAAFVVQTEWE